MFGEVECWECVFCVLVRVKRGLIFGEMGGGCGLGVYYYIDFLLR